MPLIKSPSKKALAENIKTEMEAHPSKEKRAQNIAIAYSVKKQAEKKRKKMAEGGEVADSRTPEEMKMLRGHETEHSLDHDLRDEERSSAGPSKSVGKQEIDLRDEHMIDIDEARTNRDEEMLDSHSTRHSDDHDAKMESRMSADSSDHMEDEMMDEHDEDSLLGDVPSSISDAIRSRVKMARGGVVGDEEADLQDSNGDEHLNEEDQLSFEAARKKTYYDLDQLEDQPEDSNMHSDELSDEDSHDMVGSIRRKMKSKLR